MRERAEIDGSDMNVAARHWGGAVASVAESTALRLLGKRTVRLMQLLHRLSDTAITKPGCMRADCNAPLQLPDN